MTSLSKQRKRRPFFCIPPSLTQTTHHTMKQTQQPGAFARFTGATRSYMQRRSQFARNLTAELLIGAAFFATALFTGSILTAAAFVLAGLLISRRACSTIDAQLDNDGNPIDRADDDLNEEGGAR
nr:MAG TPA: hypothetical protein [Caudoviricetes sp.]